MREERGSLSLAASLRRFDQDEWGWVPLAVAGFLLVGTRQGFTVPYTGLGLSPAQLLLLLLGALWVLTRMVGQRCPLGLGVLSALLVVRFCFLLISYGLGSGRVLTPDQRTSTDQAVAVAAVSVTVVIVTATLLHTRRDLERVLQALVAGAALSGFTAVVEYGTGIDLSGRLRLPGLRETVAPLGFDLIRGGVVRAAGASAQPLELAAVMTTLIPVAASLFFTARGRGARSWPWALAIALMAGGAVVSLSRSAFVGLFVAGLVMALRWPVRRTAAVLAAGVAVGVAALLSGSRVVEAATVLLTQGSDDFSLGSRTVGRDYVYAHLAEHFWWGQGPGTYDLAQQPVLDNQYLSQLIETGVLGLLVSVAMLACTLWYALLATSRRVDPELRELAAGIAGAVAAVVTFESVLDTAGFAQIATLISLLVGLSAAAWRIGVGPGRSNHAPAEDVRPVRPGAVEAR